MSTGTIEAPFLVLPDNQFAVTALRQLEEAQRHPTGKGLLCRLVYLFGPPGVGKSHLVRDFDRRQPEGVRTRRLTGAEFGAELAEASEAKTIFEWQQQMRALDVFICEDIHQLSGRDETQLQLIETIDAVLQQGGAVVLTGRGLPGEFKRTSTRLISRARGGVTAAMRSPAPESRAALLRHFAAVRQLPLTGDLIDLIVNDREATGRELKSLVVRIDMEARIRRQIPSLELVRAILRGDAETPEPSLSLIARRVGQQFGVSVQDLRGTSRQQTIALARHVVMHLMREMTSLSLEAVGEYLGHRNHNTVLHGCQRVEDRLATDPAFAQQVHAIRRRIGEG